MWHQSRNLSQNYRPLCETFLRMPTRRILATPPSRMQPYSCVRAHFMNLFAQSCAYRIVALAWQRDDCTVWESTHTWAESRRAQCHTPDHRLSKCVTQRRTVLIVQFDWPRVSCWTYSSGVLSRWDFLWHSCEKTEPNRIWPLSEWGEGTHSYAHIAT